MSSVAVYVQDQDRSIEFYTKSLGLRLLADVPISQEFRWVVIALPDGNTNLVLLPGSANSPIHEQPGAPTGIFLVSDDVTAKCREWSERGVRFSMQPSREGWGGIHAIFEDPDGNSFHIAESETTTAQIEAQRREVEARREAERRLTQEMTIAASVQSKLFPQRLPPLTTLEYAGLCRQARKVGGDYYDFLQLAPGRVAFVIGDVSGKGIAAALLMANLQANLRGQCIAIVDGLPGLLASVNQLFFENSPDSSYATMFFGIYDDADRRMHYVNCGHLPPLLIRRDGSSQRLLPTASVLGLFPEFHGEETELQLSDGDCLLLYTDGATECGDESGREFGEEGLLTYLQSQSDQSPSVFVEQLSETLLQFAGNQQHDDITLVMARCISS